MTEIDPIEYWKLRAENAEFKLREANREHQKEIAQIGHIINAFCKVMDSETIWTTFCAHNIRAVLNRVLEKLGKPRIEIEDESE